MWAAHLSAVASPAVPSAGVLPHDATLTPQPHLSQNTPGFDDAVESSDAHASLLCTRFGMRRVCNSSASDCWWHSHAHLTGACSQGSRMVTLAWSRRQGHRAQWEWRDLQTPGRPATDAQVDATVHAYTASYPQGLLALHAPASTAVLFRGGRKPIAMRLEKGQAMLRGIFAPEAVLYTEPHGPGLIGHFEALQPVQSAQQSQDGHVAPSQPCAAQCHEIHQANMLGGMDNMSMASVPTLDASRSAVDCDMLAQLYALGGAPNMTLAPMSY